MVAVMKTMSDLGLSIGVFVVELLRIEPRQQGHAFTHHDRGISQRLASWLRGDGDYPLHVIV